MTKALLLRTACVVLPGAALLGAAQLDLACWYFFGALVLVFTYDLLGHRHLHALALMAACTPMMILLRGRLFYSGPELLFAAAVVQAPVEDLRRIGRNRLVLWLLLASLIYWLASFLYSGNYASNFRAVELSLSAIMIYLLAQHRLFFRPALLGFALSAVVAGFGLLPNGPVNIDGASVFRLGLARIDGHSIGNPISFGTTVVLVFLLTISNHGNWLGLARHPKTLVVVQLLSAMWLVLSTSRGSWAIAILGAAVVFWAEPRQRRILLGGAVLVVLVGAFFLTFTHDSTLANYLDKTFTTDTTLAKLTTGRSRQWASFPAAWADAPLFGHGPGTSLAEGRIYFERNLIYHALPLQIGVETGTFGLVWLLVFFYLLFTRAWRYYRVTGESIALIGVLSYFAVSLTVPALDAASGCLLGLGLIGTDLSRFFVVANPGPAPAIISCWRADAMAQAE